MVIPMSDKMAGVRLVAVRLYAVLIGLIPGALIVTGVAFWSPPAAFVTAGVLLAVDKYLPDGKG